jgi:poly(rC)-binding protein 2/3/4
VGGAIPGQPLTQQIYIPNDMVGAIIGKGGAKINEIRHLSGSVIKINEPQESSNERLVTITGTAECNQMALYMLYSRLGSSTPLVLSAEPHLPHFGDLTGIRKRETPHLRLSRL